MLHSATLQVEQFAAMLLKEDAMALKHHKSLEEYVHILEAIDVEHMVTSIF